MNLIKQLFFAVSVTGTTGTIMFAIWFLCQKLLLKWNPNLGYYMLRWVVLMFLLPITYVAIIFNYDYGYVQQSESLFRMIFVSNISMERVQIYSLIWAVAVCIGIGFVTIEAMKKHRYCNYNFDDGESLAQDEFIRIKEVLGIKGKVSLLRNDHPKLKSPFVIGMFHRKVVVPYLEYSKEELDILLYHELCHIKKSDILFRYLTMLVVVLNCINIFVYLLLAAVLYWSEADCDAKAIMELEKVGITKKKYYQTIFSLMSTSEKNEKIFSIPMLFEVDSSLYRRIGFMDNYRMNMNKVAKSVTFALVMTIAMFSSTVAYAAGVNYVERNDAKFRQEQIVTVEENTIGSTWSEEFVVPAEDNLFVETVYINDGIMTTAGDTFSWEIPISTRYVTGLKWMSSGTQVQVACTASPSTCLYWFGIMNPDDSANVVEGTGSGSHTFTTNTAGFHRILAENRSVQPITVRGSYTY